MMCCCSRSTNSRLPLVVRHGAVTPDSNDPPKAFERVFSKNGWTGSWRNGVYDYHHYHSTAHEVMGIAAGSATIRFGGEDVVRHADGGQELIDVAVGHPARSARSAFGRIHQGKLPRPGVQHGA